MLVFAMEIIIISRQYFWICLTADSKRQINLFVWICILINIYTKVEK